MSKDLFPTYNLGFVITNLREALQEVSTTGPAKGIHLSESCMEAGVKMQLLVGSCHCSG